MIDAYNELGEAANLIAVEEVPQDQIASYGVVGVGERRARSFDASPAWWRSRSAATAPSNLIITGRYILQPEIFDLLENAAERRGRRNPADRRDDHACSKTQPVYGFQFEGRTFDCGSKLGFLAANVAYALARDDIAPAFRAELERTVGLSAAAACRAESPMRA